MATWEGSEFDHQSLQDQWRPEDIFLPSAPLGSNKNIKMEITEEKRASTHREQQTTWRLVCLGTLGCFHECFYPKTMKLTAKSTVALRVHVTLGAFIVNSTFLQFPIPTRRWCLIIRLLSTIVRWMDSSTARIRKSTEVKEIAGPFFICTAGQDTIKIEDKA